MAQEHLQMFSTKINWCLAGLLGLALRPVQALAQQATWESSPNVTDRPAMAMPKQAGIVGNDAVESDRRRFT